MMNKNYSELWKTLPWRKARKIVFRLQCRIFKAVQAGDNLRAKNLQKLLLKSQSARLLAIRQITQLNQGKKTAGVDGKASLSHQERLELNDFLKSNYRTWKHNKLREIPIQKKDGTLRILKVPTIADRVWQTLIKLAVEPAAEATFHARSYGFRPGRSAHDAQKIIFINLRSYAHGINKRVLELDIEKCVRRDS
jgi:retron-type reverse transcriptase